MCIVSYSVRYSTESCALSVSLRYSTESCALSVAVAGTALSHVHCQLVSGIDSVLHRTLTGYAYDESAVITFDLVFFRRKPHKTDSLFTAKTSSEPKYQD